jgi:diacylglycerol kinase family enzyme
LETTQLIEKESQLKVSQLKTTCIGDATQLAASACADYDLIIAVDGDGTCNEVINGIMRAESKDIQFGIVPNGAGNDFV